MKKEKIMLYDEMRAKHQERVNNLPMYFAFGDAQFKELMQKLGYQEEEKFLNDIFTIGAGSIVLKKDKDLVLNTFLENDKEMLQAFENDDFLLSAFEFELSNHEYIITYDISDTLRALGISWEEYQKDERMKTIMKKAVENYKKDMEKFGW